MTTGRGVLAWVRTAAVAVLSEEGSTRPAAALRVGLVLVLWSRFAAELELFMGLAPERLALSLSFYASTTLFLLGAWSRLTGAWVALTALWLHFGLGVRGGVEPYQHHHVVALALGAALIALLPTGGSWSLDRLWALRRAERAGQPPPPERGPTWARHLLALHVVSIYGWGTFAKLSPAYLNGDRFTHYLMRLYFGSDLPSFPGFGALMVVLAWSAIFIEPMIGLGLLFRRTRWAALWLGLAFHGLIYWTMPVGTFTVTMWLFFIAFFPPDELDQLRRRLSA
jgi:hypothetical protein